MGAQIVEIGGQKMAVLPVSDYERLLELAEDRMDALSAIATEQRREAGEEYLSAELVDRLMAGESALRLWRQHRQLTLQELGERVGVSAVQLSDIERGNRRGAPILWRKLAGALDVSADDILPSAE